MARPTATELALQLLEHRPEPEWATAALCAQTDPDAFFVDRGGSPLPAIRVCDSCPVRLDCLTNAIRDGEAQGIWGGTTPRQRRAIATQLQALTSKKKKSLSHNTTAARARNDKIRQLHAAGWPPPAIAATLGISERTVHRVTSALHNERPAPFETEPITTKSA